MFKINYGYGCSQKNYRTLRGARIAATRFLKSSGVSCVYIKELYKGLVCETHVHFLSKSN
jgi:hypothetical protein